MFHWISSHRSEWIPLFPLGGLCWLISYRGPPVWYWWMSCCLIVSVLQCNPLDALDDFFAPSTRTVLTASVVSAVAATMPKMNVGIRFVLGSLCVALAAIAIIQRESRWELWQEELERIEAEEAATEEEDAYAECIMQSTQVQQVLKQMWTKERSDAYDEWKEHGFWEVCALVRQHLGQAVKTEEVWRWGTPIYFLCYYTFVSKIEDLQQEIEDMNAEIDELKAAHQEELAQADQRRDERKDSRIKSLESKLGSIDGERSEERLQHQQAEDALKERVRVLELSLNAANIMRERERESQNEVMRGLVTQVEDLTAKLTKAEEEMAARSEAECDEPPSFDSIAERDAAIIEYLKDRKHTQKQAADRFGQTVDNIKQIVLRNKKKSNG